MSALKLEKIEYSDLNAKQKENFNFQKVSALLADFGYTTIKLNDDWNGADFLALHCNGLNELKVQLKGRLTFAKKYEGKDLHICFPVDNDWYLMPHDETLVSFLKAGFMGGTVSWDKEGLYSWKRPPAEALLLIAPYKL